MKVPFQKIEDEKIKEYMQKNRNIIMKSEEILLCEGSIAKAIEWQEKQDSYRAIEEIIQKIETQDLIDLFKQAEFLYKAKEDIYILLDAMIVLLYHTKDEKKLNCIQYVEETKRRLLANSNYDMSIDNLLMKMWEEINEKYNRG